MIHFVMKRIINRKSITFITILAMTTIFTLIPIGIQLSQDARLSVETTIEKYGRGSYDILVRPKDSRTDIEKSFGIVEENYIGDSSGGISLEEWEEIKQNADIEVAAPVASVGYFTGNQTSVQLPFVEYPARFTWQFFTTDGVHRYPISDQHSLTYFEYYYGNGEWPEYFTTNWDVIGARMGLWLPLNYYLVVAIDVESEGKLTGIDFTGLNKSVAAAPDSDALQSWLQDRGDPPVIPVLQREDLHIPLYISVKEEKLDISLAEYKAKYKVDKERPIYSVDRGYWEALENDLRSQPAIETAEYDVDLSQFQSPFNGTFVVITNDYTVEKGIGGSLSNDTSIYYTASKINYQIEDDSIQVNKVQDGNPPTYKEVTKHGESYLETESPPFIVWQMGTFQVPETEKQLTSSPLGIYSSEEVKTMDGTTLTPTPYPGSFISAPAAGVTTLEAAEIIKGDHPIDAIRIKVAGIKQYNADAQEKIERVASDLVNKGYEVDIVAGSSFKEQQMEVEGIGTVLSPWTTLGVAQTLTTSWNRIALVHIILFSVFGLVWFASRLLYERNALLEENRLLSMIGWTNKQIRRKNYTEQIVLLTLATIFSLCILLLLNRNMHPFLYSIPLLFWILSILFVCVLFTNKKERTKNEHKYRKWASFFHYRHLILPVMGVIFISVIFVGLQTTAMIQGIIEAKKTTLGDFATNELFYINIFLLTTTLFLTFTSVSEAMKAIFTNRQKEFQMYYTIGWTKKMIKRHLLKEVAVWAGISVILGVMFSFSLFLIMDLSLKWTFVILLSSIGLFLLPLLLTNSVTKQIQV
ncbi:ABC transporter permease [Fervidibacillus albus]|uniref:ABC transporter permease n=1 Tax=Fervidibacillus albus TaxID=2980026 RepID=A0A9E8LUF3_9BACI|nr:hypothetical protein [Fervidibacillus albus]WAA09371.1 hypothetical protein OE104_12495 [Fervidibacillus albus]